MSRQLPEDDESKLCSSILSSKGFYSNILIYQRSTFQQSPFATRVLLIQ
nr:hypothetical protein Iba_chr11aCG14190 [Ipomoea batatas]